MLQPIAVDPNSNLGALTDALADAQSIAIGFTQRTDDGEGKKVEFNFLLTWKIYKQKIQAASKILNNH